MLMDISHLNEQQQKAVLSTEGKVRVIAGAGTGKTLVLVNRYAYIVNELGVDPHNILCLTFTNKAAKEMRIRLSDKFGINISDSFVGTLHGFCLNFLRENYAEVGLAKDFSVMDREDCMALAKDVLKGKRGAKSFVYEISDWKYSIKQEFLMLINNARKQGKDNTFSDPKCQFVSRQRELNMVDYDDLILYTYSILKNNKSICHKWADKFNYIMVDEAQDCSFVDWEIIYMLSSVSDNLFVVGDPDQCIYQWRGAAPKYLVDFEPDVNIVLTENYRSTQNILDVANDIISHNEMRISKDLSSHIVEGGKPTFFYLQNEIKEGDKVANLIEGEHKHIPYKQIAILYRNSSVSRYLERALINHKIPYVIWGGVRFYERREIKDILSYLKLVAFKDDLAFRRIVNVPSRHIGPVSLEKVNQMAKERKVCLFDALPYVKLARERQDCLDKFKNDIIELMECSNSKSIVELINEVVDKFQLKDWYDKDEERIENIEELVRSAMLYSENMQKQNKVAGLKNFLQDVALYTNIDQELNKDSVRLMTIHQAKGLEFPCVFVCGLTDGVLPSRKTLEESGKLGLEEERRLMYVAVTRAKDKLYLSDSKGYSYYGEKGRSRFIGEVKREHLEICLEFDTFDVCNTDMSALDRRVSVKHNDELFINNIFGKYKQGEVVRHLKLGACVFDKYVDDQKCIVVQNELEIETITPYLSKINNDNYKFRIGQWVKDKKFGKGQYAKDVDVLNSIIMIEGQEHVVSKYDLQKVYDQNLLNKTRNIAVGDIIKYDNAFGEVYEYNEFGIKCHIDDNIAHDVIWHETNMGMRMVMRPIENRIYWKKNNNKLKLFVFKQTIKDANGIILVGVNEDGEKISLRTADFCASKYVVLKLDIAILKKAYTKISSENERINANSSTTNLIKNPFVQLEVPKLGDVVKINKKMYFFVKKENGNVVCERITTHKQVILQNSNEMETIARPYKNLFYRSKNIYYYFNAVKMFGSRPSFAGISIERGKCRPSYIGVGQVQKRNMTPCSEKEFWDNCKDKFGYICFRYNLK